MRGGLVFVHGISASAAERGRMRGVFAGLLEEQGLASLYSPAGVLDVAEWRSLGNFAMDLADLRINQVRRDEAAADVASVIDSVRTRLFEAASRFGDSTPPWLVVIGHSMGQVLAVLALQRLAQKWWGEGRRPDLPVSLLTLGGPMGNRAPWSRHYVRQLIRPPASWAGDASAALRDLGLVRWVDVWNPDDPIPCGWPSWLFGYGRPAGAGEAVRIDWPGNPVVRNLFVEHGSYFHARSVFLRLQEMAGELQRASASWNRA